MAFPAACIARTAAIDGAGRPGLLATLHPEFGRGVPRPTPTAEQGLAQVITMPRVIPMPRRGPARLHEAGEHPDSPPNPEHPDPAA
jgi:hypothetical protein